MDASTKERLIGKLSDYLDTLPDTPPAAREATREVDLYSFFTELAGLRNEVRLESRQFKGVLDEFREVFASVEASGQRLRRELDTRREDEATSIAAAERPLLLELIALRDRLQQASRLAADYRPAHSRWLARHEQALIQGLAEGLDITLRRLDQSLAAYGVSAVETLGRPLDPHSMRVMAVRAEPEQPHGVVLEEISRGYLRGARVLRLAEVIANKTEQDT